MTALSERPWKRRALGLGLAGALAGAGLLSFGRQPPPPEEEFNPRRLDVPRPPAQAGPALPVKEVRTLAPGERVLGVTAGGRARAYPLRAFARGPGQKVFNDTLGGVALAAVW
jgi:hypothetical protein